MYEGVMMNSAQMTRCCTGPVTSWLPELMVISIPYIFNSTAVALEVLDGEFGNQLNDLLIKKTGLRFLAYGHLGFRRFTNNVRPIHTPKDMKGLKIRTMESTVDMEIVKALGGSPTPINWAELYTSLQQGVVDGQEAPTSMVQLEKFYEVQKYCILDEHVFCVNPLTINETFYQSLPEDLKRIVALSAKDAMRAYRGMISYGEGYDVNDLINNKGMEIYAPSPEEIELFREASQGPVENYVIEEIGQEWVTRLHKAVSEAEERIAEEMDLEY